MIYSFTSKRGGTGRSTISLLTALYVAKSSKRNVCIVDLSLRSDMNKFLGITKKNCIDDLISRVQLEPNVDPRDYCVSYDALTLLPGTNVDMSEYLVRRSEFIMDILNTLNNKFDVVLVDIDYTILEELEGLGLDSTTFYVMSQNTIEVYDYKGQMTNKSNDVFVVNQTQDDVYPNAKLFVDNFPNVITIPFDSDLKTRVNKSKISLSTINESPCSTGLIELVDIVNSGLSGRIQKSSVNGKSKKKEKSPKKKGFFSKLLGR